MTTNTCATCSHWAALIKHSASGFGRCTAIPPSETPIAAAAYVDGYCEHAAPMLLTRAGFGCLLWEAKA